MDINDIEEMPDPPAGYKWKLTSSFGRFFRVIAVRESWPHRKLDPKIEGIVLYETRDCSALPPYGIIRAAHRYLEELHGSEENERRVEMMREYK